MAEYKFENMSNNEIRLEMKKLENSYEKLKMEIVGKINELENLDKTYIKAKEELSKRNQSML